MANPEKIAQRFLEGLHTQEARDTFDMLHRLVEMLENKPDPEMTEVRLVDNMYSFIEKLRIMESNLSSYVRESRETLPGNKLALLYDDISASGSIFRD